MNGHIQDLLKQMSELEDELRTAIAEQQSSIFFQIKGKRIEFENSLKETHKKLKTGFFQWLVINRPLNLITGPIIYAMIVPLARMNPTSPPNKASSAIRRWNSRAT